MSTKPSMYGEQASRVVLAHLSHAQFVTPLGSPHMDPAKGIQRMVDMGYAWEAKNNADSMWRNVPSMLSRLDNVSDKPIAMAPYLHSGEESERRS